MQNISKNRIIIILVLLVLLLLAILILGRIFRPASLDNPESIAYDGINKTLLISNTGNGKILSLDDKGKYHVFLSKGLKKPRGMKLIPPNLYVADNTTLHVIDVQKKEISFSIPIEGAKMLNDIEGDRNGKLYITDTAANRLFIVNPATKQVQSISSPLMTAPNGIVYDYPRPQMLIVCLSKSSPILTLELDTNDIKVFKQTLYDNLDGIAIDPLGRIYFSSWGESAIFQIPQEQNRFVQWKSGVVSPADIFYHQATNELIVPLFELNKIERFQLD